VYFSTVGTSQYIVVAANSLDKAVENPHSLPLQIGGYQVHFFPNQIYTPPAYVICPKDDLISDIIDPQRPLDPEVAAILRKHFPSSVGAQLLVSGHLVILFPDVKTLERTSSRILPVRIGSMSFSFDLLLITPASGLDNIIELPRYSRAARVSDQPSTLRPTLQSCALGVKVYIPARSTTAWTSPTHAWVPTSGQKMSWKKSLADVVQYLAFWRKNGRHQAVGQSETASADAVGKTAFYEGSHEAVNLLSDLLYHRLTREMYRSVP
jgi:hypothetical protein